jgi:hypothetical protein
MKSSWQIKFELWKLINLKQCEKHVDRESWEEGYPNNIWPPHLISTSKYFKKSIPELEEELLGMM